MCNSPVELHFARQAQTALRSPRKVETDRASRSMAPDWVHSSKGEHAAFNRSVMVRFHLDPPTSESKPVRALGWFAKPIAPSRVCDSGSLLSANHGWCRRQVTGLCLENR